MKNLEELTEKIRKRLPHLKVSDDIGLAEIMIALFIKQEESSGWLRLGMDGEFLDLYESEQHTGIYYDLQNPLLKDQSEEVINFLNEL